MEDFGYQKDGENERFSGMMRKVFLGGAALISLALFVYITVNAYYFVYYDKDNDVEVIKAPEGPIKEVIESEAAEGDAAQMHSIYQDIFGNGREADVKNAKIRKAPEPVIPSKAEQDRRLIKGNLPAADKKVITAPVAPQATQPVVAVEKASSQPNTFVEKDKGQETANTAYGAAADKKDRRKPIHVQVAAMTSKDAAKDYWNKINGANSSIFSGLRPYVEEVDLGKRGIFYRLQIGNFFNQIDAEEFCSRYIAQSKKDAGGLHYC
jgi:hypothetical protein